MDNIRVYNQMFNMTSLGEKVEESINNGRGPKSHFFEDVGNLQGCLSVKYLQIFRSLGKIRYTIFFIN